VPALLDLLRAVPGPAAEVRRAVESVTLPNDSGEGGWRFAKRAAVHGLAAVALAALRSAGLELQSAAQADLERDALGVQALVARHRALAARCLDALRAKGVVPVALKGYSLACRIYDVPEQRPATDVDFLLAPQELPAAEAAMGELGLAPAEGPEAAYAREHHHSVNFHGPGQLVELHHRALMAVGRVLESEPLIARSREGTLEGRAVRWLAAEDEVVYLAAHAASHAFARLSWLYDLKLYAVRQPVDWERAARRARDAGIHGPAYFGLALAQRALGAAIPEAALDALRPSRWQAAVVERLFDAERLEASYFWTHRFAGYAAMPLVASDLPSMARYVTHHLWRGSRRKLALRFPAWAPERWRG
jgi:hypothetical protein